jgi:hypothetical protein
MLVAVGMYLPLGTTFAIFCGGMIKGIVDRLIVRRKMNDAQKARVENVGILLAAGLIAGEALTGLVHAALKFFNVQIPKLLANPSYGVGLGVLVLMALYLVVIPLRKAGRPDEPPPPSAII